MTLDSLFSKTACALDLLARVLRLIAGAVCLLPVLIIASSQCDAATIDPAAELVLLGGNVVTVDDRIACAEAIAVRGERIVAVGGNHEIRRLIGQGTRVMVLDGKTVVPGLIEGHAHFLELGRSKKILDLTVAKSWEEVAAIVREAAGRTPHGCWITGRGWHQDKWSRMPEPNVEGYPTHELISRAAPDHPVLLTHASGHATLANSRAMELANVTAETRDPPGGEVLRDAQGHATGVFREKAASLLLAARGRDERPKSDRDRIAELDESIRLATAECLRHGVTSFHDAGASLATIDYYRRLAEDGRLEVRLWVMIGEPNRVLQQRLSEYRILGAGNHHLTVRAIKRFMDGALGTHGAWLLAPYCDLPSSCGLNVTPPPSLRETAQLAIKHDFQLATHAIGDRANRETLDIYAAAFRAHPHKKDLRWRIEHAQHVDPADAPRFGRLGVVAAMQAVHATSDAPFVVERLDSKRAEEGAYAWRTLLDAGGVVVNGSDAPVERIDPIASFYASVTRKQADGAAFFPGQSMTRREALRSYTLAAAYAAFEEDLKGSITPGKLADLVILDRDITTVPEEEILDTRVLATILGGRIVFERQDSGL